MDILNNAIYKTIKPVSWNNNKVIVIGFCRFYKNGKLKKGVLYKYYGGQDNFFMPRKSFTKIYELFDENTSKTQWGIIKI